MAFGFELFPLRGDAAGIFRIELALGLERAPVWRFVVIALVTGQAAMETKIPAVIGSDEIGVILARKMLADGADGGELP